MGVRFERPLHLQVRGKSRGRGFHSGGVCARLQDLRLGVHHRDNASGLGIHHENFHPADIGHHLAHVVADSLHHREVAGS